MPKPISTRAHGALDYLTAAALYALPRALGWSDRATDFMTRAAVGTVAYSLITRYERGLVKLLPMRAHLGLDALNGAAFCAAPLILPDEDPEVTNTMVGIGLFELAVTALSETMTPAERQRAIPDRSSQRAYERSLGRA